jgi:hypothetical protein
VTTLQILTRTMEEKPIARVHVKVEGESFGYEFD